MAMWMMNVLANAFEVLDKYMLLHMATTPHAGQGAVGQFHSGMIIPALLSSLTMMLGGLVLPYLSADWENGKKDQIRLNLQMIFKAIAFGFTLLSASALMVAPWIFEGLLSNRYQDGLQLLPIALAHCIWMSIATLMQSYLWCREKGRSIALATGSGIALNFVLNLWLIPRFGTQGAILATAASGILILCITMLLLESLQCKMDRRTYVFALLPFTLMVYAEFSLAAIALVAFVCSKSDFLLSHKEKEGIDRAIVPSLEKLGLKIKTLW